MKYGLSDEQLKIILDFLSKEPAIEEAVLFGSRVMDTFKEASDIDLAIKGDSFDLFMANSLKSRLEDETNIPFFFDIIAYKSIKSEELKQHIRDKGVVIYRKGMGAWKECKLKALGSVITGKTPSKNNPEDWGDEMPFVTPS
ncbi:MAG: nucleotidyltransferase domain-containing protein, partial [Deltaproteobacteria bacterium]|nr:nucleotidyltransferase domain-containing protein [Deltaproteobacteria bacterium]